MAKTDFTGIFDNVGKTTDEPSNPFAGIFDRVGQGEEVSSKSAVTIPETTFAKVRKSRAGAKEAEEFAEKESRIGTFVKKTITGAPKAAFQIAKTAVTDPVETAKAVVTGVTNGLTLGAHDFLAQRAFVKEAQKSGMDEETARSLSKHILEPDTSALKGIRGGSEFLGILAPWVAAEKVLLTGMKYAAPQFVKNHAVASRFLTNMGLFNAIGQTEESFRPADERDRKTRAIFDTVLAGGFSAGGIAFRRLSQTKFNKPKGVSPASGVEPIIEGAVEKTVIATEKALIKNKGNAKMATTIEVGAEGATKDVTVITNDLKSLQNYIKGSGEVTYKEIGTLGKDAAGNKITARHEFNPKTGEHTIFATKSADASTLAHELGHFFDKSLSKSVSGLSRLMPEFEANRGAIEDILTSFAVSRLGGKATSKQITAEIKKIVSGITKETEALSAARKGKADVKVSEQFADAVSEILTKRAEAPVLTQLMKHASDLDVEKVFGKAVTKAVGKDKKFADAPVAKAALKKEEVKAEAAKVIVKKEAAEKVIEKEAAKVVEKEVPLKLERTPTGKIPKTPPIRAEKITSAPEIEAFINTKVLPTITGKQRISKSNQDIIDRSLSSKMTEKEFSEILTTRFGNQAEDIVKAKRMMVDKVQNVRDTLIGKNIDDLSPKEMGDLMKEYNQLTEMFEVFAGVRTELSNSFRSLGLEVVPGENDILRGTLKEMQRILGKEGDDFTFMQKALKLRENDIVDTYFNIWYPAVLSGPKTSARNIVGTGSNLMTETAASLFTQTGRTEFMARATAIVQSSKDAWNRAKRVLKGEETVYSKFEDAPSLREADFKGKFAFLNNMEYVGRFLNAQDIFFSTIAAKGEIAAMRAGKFTYGLTDKAVIKKLDEAVSVAYGQRITYRNPYEDTAISQLGKNITNIKQSENKFLKAGATFIFPFVRTLVNVTERKIDYIPILNLWRTLGKRNYNVRARRIVTNAGLKGKEADRVIDIVAERLKHQQMGKFYMGMTVMSTFVPLATAGRITGSGPKSRKERDALMAKGWRPNSIILPGGVVLPYQFLGPLAGIFSVLGNINDGIKYNNEDDVKIAEKIGEGLRAILQSELDQSMMAGLSAMGDLINGYKSFNETIADFVSNTAIPIPAAWTQPKDILFPERFEARTFWEKIQNKLGVTGGLEPNLDVFGKQKSADLIWGLTPKVLNTADPVLNWMDENAVFVSKPNRKQTIKGRKDEKRDMTPEEYTQFVQDSGEEIYEKMERKIKSGSFDRMSKEKQESAVNKIQRDARAKAKRKIKF